MSPCPSQADLERYQRGELDAAAAEALESHARGCARCHELVTSLSVTQTLLEDVRTVLERQRQGAGAGAPGWMEGNPFGDYQVGPLLGEGGMARVYRAAHQDGGSPVALKVLKRELLASPDICARFEREARAMAKIKHPHVVTIFDCPRDHDTTAIAMELLDGGTLAEWIDLQRAPAGRRDVSQVVRCALAAAQGLAAAHAQGLVHRDIKPANLLFSREGTLKIVDFGVVQALESATWVTGLGHHIGTPAYMSPEQCRGERASKASDIYSVGVTVYEMLTGRLPFEVHGGSPFAQMLKHISEMPADLRDQRGGVPDWLGAIVMKCLHKDPDQRYADGAALVEALAAGRPARVAEPAEDQARATWHLNVEAITKQLWRLPQRAIVAWACRRARRVQHLNPDPRLERSIAMAEAVSRGAADSLSTTRALQRVQRLRAASLKAAYTEPAEGQSEAARKAAVAAAATSACAAAKSAADAAADAAFAAENAVAALRADGRSARSFWKSARRDYEALLHAQFGKEGTIGDPVPELFWAQHDRSFAP